MATPRQADDIEEAIVAIETAMAAIGRRRQAVTLGRRMAGRLPSGLTPSSVVALDVIAAEEEPVTVGSLAESMAVDQPRASRLAAGLVTAGLVTRQADPADGRRSLLRVTAAGDRLLGKVRATRRAAFTRAIAHWPDDDRAHFARLLADFVAHMPGPA